MGTPVKNVLKLSGIEDFSDYAVIGGGPMMGPVLADINGFITKKDKGFVILKKDHFLIKKEDRDERTGKKSVQSYLRETVQDVYRYVSETIALGQHAASQDDADNELFHQ